MKKMGLMLMLALLANTAFAQEEEFGRWYFGASLSIFSQWGPERFMAGLNDGLDIYMGANVNEDFGAHAHLRMSDIGASPLYQAFINVNPLGLIGIDAARLDFRFGLIDWGADSHAIATTYNPHSSFSLGQDSWVRRMTLETVLSFAAFPELFIRWASDLGRASGIGGNRNVNQGGAEAPFWGLLDNDGWVGLVEVDLIDLDLSAVNLSVLAYSRWFVNNVVTVPDDGFGNIIAVHGDNENHIGGSLRVDINNLPLDLAVGGSFEFTRILLDGNPDDVITGMSFSAGVELGLPDLFSLAINYGGNLSDDDWLADSDYDGVSGVIGLDFDWLGISWIRPFVSVGVVVGLTDAGEAAREDWFNAEMDQIDRLAWAIGVDFPISTTIIYANIITGWQRGTLNSSGHRGFEANSTGLGSFYLTLRLSL